MGIKKAPRTLYRAVSKESEITENFISSDSRQKNYILDTNVLLHDPGCFLNFRGNHVYIPITVLEELDHLKSKDGLVGYQAREAVRTLHRRIDGRGRQCVSEGIELSNNVTLHVAFPDKSGCSVPGKAIDRDPARSIPLFESQKNDNEILACAMKIKNESKETETFLVSKDVCLRIKAEVCDIPSQDYETDKIKTDELYTGYCHLTMSDRSIGKVFDGGAKPPKTTELFPNQFAVITSRDNDKHTALAKFDGAHLVPLRYSNHSAWGLTPKNLEQKMAFELLMDPSIPFVTITGGAGSGKTILATAVALEKVLEQREYRKIVFVRPTVPVGNDIGYLPGTEEDKLRPWMGSFYDAIDNLMTIDKEGYGGKRNKKGEEGSQIEQFIEDFRKKGVFEIKTFTYMRGRTISDAIVIVDEAQEITPHLAKLMLTRAGERSKFIFLGDPSDNQIDNVLVDSKSNGLVYVIERMNHHAVTGHVTLRQVERSLLAGIAEKSL
ncbi:MAG: PhoH family protein [Clostridiales bacterium]|nr:PhoH family protein [Clostridiales bacterium]